MFAQIIAQSNLVVVSKVLKAMCVCVCAYVCACVVCAVRTCVCVYVYAQVSLGISGVVGFLLF